MLYVYHCEYCGNLLAFKEQPKTTPICCGSPMEFLSANSVDAAKEKHVPVITIEGKKVKVVVGTVEHPMSEDHYINYILLETDKGIKKAFLNPGQKPMKEFTLEEGEKPLRAYEYCTKHGLWMAEVK
jgi:superoxide reductase